MAFFHEMAVVGLGGIRLFRQIIGGRVLLNQPVAGVGFVVKDHRDVLVGQRLSGAQAARALFRDLRENRNDGRAGRVTLKDRPDNPRAVVGGKLAVHLIVAQHVIVPHMADTLLPQPLVCPAHIF